MFRDLEHPEITCALRTGYPSWKQEDDDEEDFDEDDFDEDEEQDDYEAYCDRCYEEYRDRILFGD